MNRGVAVLRIQERLGFSTALASNIAAALQDVQVEMEREKFLPKFLLQIQSSLVTVASQETVTLPTGFLREFEDDGPLWYLDSSNGLHELHKDDLTFLRNNNLGSEDVPLTGAPTAYALGPLAFHIFPLPDAIYNLRLSFYKADDVLSSDSIENKWLREAHEVMMGKAGLRIAEARRDRDAIAFFTNMEARGMARLVFGGEAREHEGRRYQMGGED